MNARQIHSFFKISNAKQSLFLRFVSCELKTEREIVFVLKSVDSQGDITQVQKTRL